jgi:hypothetical protein
MQQSNSHKTLFKEEENLKSMSEEQQEVGY